ncbi:hypothetical protein B9G39_08445 [Zooshikella ganghwensis]|uniref:Uncharacterized protein n=1 Tax=Zooshikella ganghwensis TaxID=202772 RepID=A0A4P9VM54_9GAMM|nr:hypothetical protein B9G39_08445 [Zooshikella ganghwensis]
MIKKLYIWLVTVFLVHLLPIIEVFDRRVIEIFAIASFLCLSLFFTTIVYIYRNRGEYVIALKLVPLLLVTIFMLCCYLLGVLMIFRLIPLHH